MLTEAQIDRLLSYHERLQAMLTKCAANRNDVILPQLGLEATHVPKVCLLVQTHELSV